MNNLLKREFIFIYNTKWSEAELLKNFIKTIKKDPKLCEIPAICLARDENGRYKRVPNIIQNYNTFNNLNLQVQKYFVRFDLEKFRYPAFLALCYAIQCSFIKNKDLDNKEIYFRSYWEYPAWDNKYLQGEMTSEKYKNDRELPLNDTFYWTDELNK